MGAVEIAILAFIGVNASFGAAGLAGVIRDLRSRKS